MQCPHCQSTHTSPRPERTEVGYQRFRCKGCHQEFNERTGTPFNRLQYPSDVVCLVVLWRLRYKLSFRDLAELQRLKVELQGEAGINVVCVFRGDAERVDRHSAYRSTPVRDRPLIATAIATTTSSFLPSDSIQQPSIVGSSKYKMVFFLREVY